MSDGGRIKAVEEEIRIESGKATNCDPTEAILGKGARWPNTP